MIDDINTKRTKLANQMAAAGAANLDFTGTAAVLAAIPDTEPQQYVAAGTAENIAAILPATICPQRRQKHGERPTEPLQFDSPAATSGDAPADLYEAFKAAFLSWNGFHTEDELAGEWRRGSLSGEMFRAGAAVSAATKPTADAESAWKQYIGQRTQLMDTSSNRAVFAAGYSAAATKPTADLSDEDGSTARAICKTVRDNEQHGISIATARRILSLLATKPAAAPAAPEGWKMVPVEPTPSMSAAGFCVSEAEHDPSGVYRAMLAAAPAASTTGAAQTAEQVRNQALEEAAKTAEATRVAQVQYGLSIFQDGDGTRDDIATAIRALKSRPTPTRSSEAGDAS